MGCSGHSYSLVSSTHYFVVVKTRNVDITITNLLEGHVKYDPIPTLQEVTAASNHPNRSGGGGGGGGGVTVSRSFSSAQRQLSLEERKRNLLEQARR